MCKEPQLFTFVQERLSCELVGQVCALLWTSLPVLLAVHPWRAKPPLVHPCVPHNAQLRRGIGPYLQKLGNKYMRADGLKKAATLRAGRTAIPCLETEHRGGRRGGREEGRCPGPTRAPLGFGGLACLHGSKACPPW